MKNKEKSLSPLPKKSDKDTPYLSFPDAVKAIIGGARVKRVEWSSKSEYCLMKDNFLMIHRDGKFHTWIVSEGDMLAIDWVLL